MNVIIFNNSQLFYIPPHAQVQNNGRQIPLLISICEIDFSFEKVC